MSFAAINWKTATCSASPQAAANHSVTKLGAEVENGCTSAYKASASNFPQPFEPVSYTHLTLPTKA